MGSHCNPHCFQSSIKSNIHSGNAYNVEVVGGGSVMQYTVQFISRPVAKQVF